MYRKIIVAMLLTCSLSATAHAVPVVTVGDWYCADATRTIEILVSGGDPVQGVTLVLEVGDDELGLPKPIITAVDLIGPGTIFHDNHTGQINFPGNSPPGLSTVSLTSASSGTVAAEGVLAYVTFDNSQSVWFPYSLSLSQSTSPMLATNFRGEPAMLLDGYIWGQCPEPTSVVLGFFALAGLCVVALRRRRRVC